MPPDLPDSAEEAGRLRRRLERERKARQEAEAVSERGLRQLYERNQQLALLEKIAGAANQTTAADDALRLAIREVCSFNGWDVGHVYHIEGAPGARRLRSARIWHGADSIALAPFRLASEEAVFDEGIGLPGRVVVSGKAAWIRDVCEDGNFPRGRFARQCGLRAASAFPVLSGDQVVAVLEFFARVPREPDEAFLQILSQIGLQLGRAIERQYDSETVNRRAEELVHARDQAQSADRAKTEFLANMSHELRTPLNSIIGFSELMMKESFGPHNVASYRDYSKYIHDSGRHLLSIINDILDLSKIEAGRGRLDYEEPMTLAVLIAELQESVSLQAEQKHIALEIAVAAGLPDLLGSARMVRQILTNLVSNALKFTADDGTVAVTAALVDSGEILLCVADTGVGMSEEEIAIALTPFGQVDSTLSRSHEGTGLGLPLARAMAKLHQAEFRVSSVKGVGTSVEIAFPAARLIRPVAEPVLACA
jgi:signal transduction histidine kinase